MDPALEESIRRLPSDVEIEAVALLRRGRAPPPELRVVASFDPVVTCRVATGRIRAVRAHPAVCSLKAARVVEPAMAWVEGDGSGVERAVPVARRQDATGRGVVLAFLDWGMDFAHPNFRRPDGGTRLRALWDQRGLPGGRPNRYGYGRILLRDEIDAALRRPDPYAALGYHPGDFGAGGGHGTHVADIAAGNGSAPGTTPGLAPDADLMFIHLASGFVPSLDDLGSSVRILEGIDLVRTLAGRDPWVANLSLGRTGGDHTGCSLVERAMDAVLESAPGCQITQSGGNYSDKRLHAEGLVEPGRSVTLEWDIREFDPTTNELEIWYSGRDELGLVLSGPGGAPRIDVPLGERRPIEAGGRIVGFAYHRARDPVNGDHHIDVFLEPGAPPGSWVLRLDGRDVVDGRFHAWIERDAGPASQSRFGAAWASPRSTIGTIATGRRTLVVGALDPRTGGVAHFSSWGPTRDGRRKPDLGAWGVGIAAARSTPPGQQPGSGGVIEMSGTSMATPHVAGAVALVFELAPRKLAVAETRRIVLASTDPIAGDPQRTGSGALNVEAALDAVRALFDGKERHMAVRGEVETGTDGGAPRYEADDLESVMTEALGAADEYEVVGRPGELLEGELRSGDVMVRLDPRDGEPLVGRIAGAEPRETDGRAESETGAEAGAWYVPAHDWTAAGWETELRYRRALDSEGCVPAGQVLLRRRVAAPEEREGPAAAEPEPASFAREGATEQEDTLTPADVAPEMKGRELELTAPWTSIHPKKVYPNLLLTLPKGTAVKIGNWDNTSAFVFTTLAAPTAGLAAGELVILPKAIVTPRVTPVAGVPVYVAEVSAIQKKIAEEDARLAKEKPGSAEHKRLTQLQRTRYENLNEHLIVQTMLNAFDAEIAKWTKYHNDTIAKAQAWPELSAAWVKSMIVQESLMGTSGRHLLPADDDLSKALKTRFNLLQAIDSWGPQQLIMIQELEPALLKDNGLDRIPEQREALEKEWARLEAKKSRTSAEQARFAYLDRLRGRDGEWRKFFVDHPDVQLKPGAGDVSTTSTAPRGFRDVVVEFLSKGIPARSHDYAFWIRTGIRWLFEKRKKTPTWSDAVRAFNGLGGRAEFYRAIVLVRARAADAAAGREDAIWGDSSKFPCRNKAKGPGTAFELCRFEARANPCEPRCVS